MRSVSPELPLSEAVIEAMKAIPPKGRLSRSDSVRCPYPGCKKGIRTRLLFWVHFRERHTQVLAFPEVAQRIRKYRETTEKENRARHFRTSGFRRARLRKEVHLWEQKAGEIVEAANRAREKLGWAPVEIREKEAIPA